MDVAFVLYPNMTALDLIGPYEVLSGIPLVRPHFVAASRDLVRADQGLVMAPTTTFDELPAVDVVVVPGSSHWKEALDDTALISWLRAVHQSTRWTTSVCTGSTLLAEAGLVDIATTHWAVRDFLAGRGVEVSTDRVVRSGKVITAAGVSAGIDMALRLVGLEFGDAVAQTVQLAIEYDPEPPYEYSAIPPEIADGVRSLIG
ncbi:glutamine amidotransferase [Lentzea sp. NBRC 105346]|uniref:DJ-1/PfpI family protein n=1 Tax=Lentzea sp. NBRC 105346 TaxID=3032205 RepID=UPI0024A4306E|nr:DJ-1/PfpI family protein [Lentzea sp. NBRC 105346]GLZ31647.1 glutamine amidotransferase [Lentzea sp. NBRC 105346]